MPENTRILPHTLVLDDRKSLTVSGVVDVKGFDDHTVNIILQSCALVVKGTSLHISKLDLDSSEVSVDGEISAMQYISSSRDKSVKSRLLK